MKNSEIQELKARIDTLTYERNELHKNYVNARKDVASEVLSLCMDYCKGQGDVCYESDLLRLAKVFETEIKKRSEERLTYRDLQGRYFDPMYEKLCLCENEIEDGTLVKMPCKIAIPLTPDGLVYNVFWDIETSPGVHKQRWIDYVYACLIGCGENYFETKAEAQLRKKQIEKQLKEQKND